MASDRVLQAELAVPLSSATAAHTRNVRRLAEMRQHAESWYLGKTDRYVAGWEDLQLLASRYGRAVWALRQTAGKPYADRVDGEFVFPFRQDLGP